MLSIPFGLKLKYKKDKTCLIQKYKPLSYIDREGIPVRNASIVLFKRVSHDFKTQENTVNETLWKLNTTVMHSHWEPTINECGSGKFHACSRPYFCDMFRSIIGDRYIAIEIAKKDLYEWPNATYPHKIAFRMGKVLFECDRFGNKIEKREI